MAKKISDSLEAARNIGKTPGRPILPSAPQSPSLVKVQPIEDEVGFDTPTRFAFMGLGQGGCRMADKFYSYGYRRVGLYNSTDQDFEGLDPAIVRWHAGAGGAAKDMQRAVTILANRKSECMDLFSRAWGPKFDWGIICAGLGGGTGGGSIVSFVQLAKSYAKQCGVDPERIGALVSLPRRAEGAQVCANAARAFRALLSMKVTPLIVIDNEKINDVFAPSMRKLHDTANESIVSTFNAFNYYAGRRSTFSTFDTAEWLDILSSGILALGASALDATSIHSVADVSAQVRSALAGRVLADVDLSSGRVGAAIMVASEDVLDRFSSDYFDAGFSAVVTTLTQNDPNKVVLAHRGLYGEDDNNDSLFCFTAVGGLQPPKRLKELEEEGKLAQGDSTSAGSYFGL